MVYVVEFDSRVTLPWQLRGVPASYVGVPEGIQVYSYDVIETMS